MEKTMIRSYRLDGDLLEVLFIYDEEWKRYSGVYPSFDEHPRITPEGRNWVNTWNDGCPYAEEDFSDCGSCRFFRREHPGDLIGVCDNPDLINNKHPE